MTKRKRTGKRAKAPVAALTPRQLRFVAEYIVDLNATQAAIRAGYSRKTAYSIGQRLLKNVEIHKAVQEAKDARSMRTLVRADRVLEEAARLAFVDIRGFFTEQGRLKLPHELTDDQAAALASIETFEEYAGKGEDRELIGYTRKVKFWDKRATLEMLAKHLGLLKERVEHSGELTIRRTIVHAQRSDNGEAPDGDA